MSTQNSMNENDPHRLSAVDQELEAALASVRPAAASVRRDLLLFEAGRRSAQRPLAFWRSTSALLAACVLSAMLLPMRSSPPTTTVIVRQASPPLTLPMESPSPPPRVERGEPFAYLQLRSRVLQKGLDGLPDLPQGRSDAIIPSLRPGRME